MDKLAKRIRYNPDGTLLIRRWDDKLIVKGKLEAAPADSRLKDIQLTLQEDLAEDLGNNWETELDYY